MSYKIQIDDFVRDATPDEAKTIDALRAQDKAQQEAAEQRVAARISAVVKLKALGLTDHEVAALIGA